MEIPKGFLKNGSFLNALRLRSDLTYDSCRSKQRTSKAFKASIRPRIDVINASALVCKYDKDAQFHWFMVPEHYWCSAINVKTMRCSDGHLRLNRAEGKILRSLWSWTDLLGWRGYWYKNANYIAPCQCNAPLKKI